MLDGQRFSGYSGPWQVEDIGGQQPSNDPDPLYVVVEDSSGNRQAVDHPDPEAVLGIDWQAWQIPLDAFNGVDLSRVRKIVIGVGDRDSASSGGIGLLYIDDIGFGTPLAR